MSRKFNVELTTAEMDALIDLLRLVKKHGDSLPGWRTPALMRVRRRIYASRFLAEPKEVGAPGSYLHSLKSTINHPHLVADRMSFKYVDWGKEGGDHTVAAIYPPGSTDAYPPLHLFVNPPVGEHLEKISKGLVPCDCILCRPTT